jgi:pimeloyl-ACP methyl ester carboxylesterase
VPRRSRLAAGLLAALVAAVSAGCTVPTFAPNSGSDAGAEPGPGISSGPKDADWRPCPEVPRGVVGQAPAGMTYSCATVSVPRSWTDAGSGETYGISLLRIRSKNQQNRIGSLLVNPGGPGASGIDTAVILSFGERFGGLPAEITDRFDIIGFDPRGVGRSDAVKCVDPADQDASFGAPPDPVNQPQFDAIVELNRKIAAGCKTKYGDQLPLFSTEQAAKDMDAIRIAIADDKLTYLGFSYGTLLGATYAQLFPDNVRAMVLDGAVDPRQTLVEGSEAQAKGFERAFTNFTNWCTQNAGKCPIAPDARKAVTTAIAAAGANPVPYSDGRAATPGWIFMAMVSSLYSEVGWPLLATSIAGLAQGNAKGVFTLADQYTKRREDGTYTNMFDANTVVNCADNQQVPTVEQVRRLQGEWRKKYPMFGTALAVGMLPCVLWQGERDPYPTGAATGAPPVLVVGTTGDPATPYENTADLASMLGVGRVLTWEGEGHTAYPSTPCIVRAVDDYLIDLQVPQEGLRCPAK